MNNRPVQAIHQSTPHSSYCTILPYSTSNPFHQLALSLLLLPLPFIAFQTLEGLSLSQVNAPSFLTALQKTLTTALKLPVEVYPLTSSAHRRQLLVGISISYSFSVLSGLSSDAVITRLRTVIFSGLFLAVLKSNTGLDVVDVSELVILDFSPTSSPSEAPASQASCTCSDVERTD